MILSTYEILERATPVLDIPILEYQYSHPGFIASSSCRSCKLESARASSKSVGRGPGLSRRVLRADCGGGWDRLDQLLDFLTAGEQPGSSKLELATDHRSVPECNKQAPPGGWPSLFAPLTGDPLASTLTAILRATAAEAVSFLTVVPQAVFGLPAKTPVHHPPVVYGMNPSASSNEQQGDPSWSTENWDNPGAVGSALDQGSNPYSSVNRLEWEWDPMILAQHPGGGGSTDGPGGDGDRMLKNQISGGPLSSLRASYSNMSMLSGGLPSNFTNNHIGIFSSAGIRNYGSLNGSAQLSSSNLQSVLGPSGIPGLAATSGTGLDNDVRSFDQRRREFFAAGMHDHHVKREEMNDGHARIGLNLGVRTYFSTEETAANRLGKRHRAGSPGSQVPMCQAEGCKADLSTAKQYHRRHKVCELHSKAPNVVAGGQTQRFCQQCSRFHSLGEFDDGKRSCRKRLADHNRRRRKPQPNGATSGGAAVECIGLKNGDDDPSDSKSMLMPLKSRSSPSSVSLEDSDEKPGSVGNNLQLRSSGQGYGKGLSDDQHPSAHSGMINSKGLTGSEAQALLSAMSTSPLSMIQNSKRSMSMIGSNGSHGQDHSVYQHLQAVQTASTGQSGPNLSLSSLGGQLSHHGGGRSQAISGHTYSGMESPAAPWMRPLSSRSDMTQVVGRQGAMNLQHLMSTDSKPGITNSPSANSSNSQEHEVQAYSSSSQSLIAREIASPEWMLGSMAANGQTPRSGSNGHFGTSSMNQMSGNGQLDSGQQIMSLIVSSPNQGGGNLGDGVSNQSGEQAGDSAMEFMQQHNSGADSGGENNSRGGGITVDSPDMKYPELQAMRPYGSGSSGSIYDSHHNLLSGNFSYETMA